LQVSSAWDTIAAMLKAAATVKLETHRLSIRTIISPRPSLGPSSDKVPPLAVKSKLTLCRFKGWWDL
jgi:hypothetical protein